MKIRAQQCLTFPIARRLGRVVAALMHNKLAPLQEARALLTAETPGATPTLTPNSLPGTMLRERFTWFPSGWTTFFFQPHQHFSDLWTLCPRGRPADLPASDWSLRSINFGEGGIHSSGQERPRGRRQGVCPGHTPSIRCVWILFYHLPIRRAYDLGCDLWAYPDE